MNCDLISGEWRASEIGRGGRVGVRAGRFEKEGVCRGDYSYEQARRET